MTEPREPSEGSTEVGSGWRASARRHLGTLRVWELVPEAVLVAGLTYFLVDEPDAATSAFESSRAVALMVAVGAVWILARIALTLLVRWPALRAGVFAAAAIGVLAIVVVPAYDNTTVVETFPGANAAVRSTTSTTAVPEAGHPAPSTPTTPAPAAPVLVGADTLVGIDHRATGTVNLYRQPDGSHVVGLEDIDVQPGPDYDVYVVPGPDRDDLDGAVRLDDLRGNRGTQFYAVGPGPDLGAGPWTVLIWCQTFSVPIANATPA